MIPGSSLEALAARWAARPEPGVFAALAEGLAKRGDLAEAGRVVAAGLARYPGHIAGLLVQARVALAAGDRPLAQHALAVLLERDPGHPVAAEMLAAVGPTRAQETPPVPAAVEAGATPPPAAMGHDAAPVPSDDESEGSVPPAAEVPEAAPAPPPPAGDAAASPLDQDATAEAGRAASPPLPDATAEEEEAPPIITESLAALYHRQGHLEEALAAYAELAARDPSNDSVAARHEAIRRELVAQRPLPFDARESGGRSVAAWLGAVAAARPAAGRGGGEASFDAFYEPPPAPADATADFDAFQRWLEELSR